MPLPSERIFKEWKEEDVVGRFTVLSQLPKLTGLQIPEYKELHKELQNRGLLP